MTASLELQAKLELLRSGQKGLNLCQVYRSEYFGLCRVIAPTEEPDVFEAVPLEFDHPFGTVFLVAGEVEAQHDKETD